MDINNLHPVLKFKENCHLNGITSQLVFHATAPKRYEKSVVPGYPTIHKSCNNRMHFHDSLEKEKGLENKQYPPAFYNPILEETITRLINSSEEKETKKERKLKCMSGLEWCTKSPVLVVEHAM